MILERQFFDVRVDGKLMTSGRPDAYIGSDDM
jgi:hypothetical protein